MKITEYPTKSSLQTSDVLLTDGADGTKTIDAQSLAKALPGLLESDDFYTLLDQFVSPEQHRMIFRGKNLGSSFTTEQQSQIQSGKFHNLWLGDYWKIGEYSYRIVDFDYWNGIEHHLVMMPDEVMGHSGITSSDVFDGGYYNSDLRNTGLDSIKATISDAFGSGSVLTHKDYFVSETQNGSPVKTTIADSTVDIPSQIMMCGTNIQAVDVNAKAAHLGLLTSDIIQFALFATAPKFRIGKLSSTPQECWLRDSSSSATFVSLTSSGGLASIDLTYTLGIRPVFAIG